MNEPIIFRAILAMRDRSKINDLLRRYERCDDNFCFSLSLNGIDVTSKDK